MSRIGKAPIPVGDKVKVDVAKNNLVTVKGPKGELAVPVDPDISVEVRDGEMVVTRPTEQKRHKSLHGLYRALLNSAVVGVTEGYKRELEVIGVGYRAEVAGGVLQLLVQLPAVRRLTPGMRLTLDRTSPPVRDVLGRFGPVVVGRGVVQVMRQAQPANQWKFVWNPTTAWWNLSYLSSVWPGAEYVDIVGIDLYDQSWVTNTYPYPSDCDAACRLTRQQIAWSNSVWYLSAIRDFAVAHGKPMAIPETAAFFSTST